MKKPSHRGPRRRATEAREDAAEPQESSEAMTEHTEHASSSAEGTTRTPQAATNGNGTPTAQADGAADSQTMHRAEELVDRAAERVSHFVSAAGRKVLQWFARAREEVEDIVAEAQHIRRGGDK